MAGQDWDFEIRKAVKGSDVVIVCLSRSSVTKAGYVQKEIRAALDVADEKPDGDIFLIPLRLETCNVPDRLKKLHWVDLFAPTGYLHLKNALRERAKQLTIKRNFEQEDPRTIRRGDHVRPRDGEERS